jgi:DNA-binding transcriptional ArsR family regulator
MIVADVGYNRSTTLQESRLRATFFEDKNINRNITLSLEMGITKSGLFKKRQNRIASLAKAFDHPARVAIIEYLLSNETCICNDLVNELPLSQSTITQHLKELKQVGIIKGEIEGPKVNYCIDQKVWEEARDMFINMFAKFVPKNDCC